MLFARKGQLAVSFVRLLFVLQIVAQIIILLGVMTQQAWGAAPAEPAAFVSGEKDRVKILVLKPQTDRPQRVHDAEIMANLLTAQLATVAHFELSSYTDLSELLEADGDSEACADQSCAMEIAGALGVRYVISSWLGQRNGVWMLRLAVHDLDTGKNLGQRAFSASRIEDLSELIDRDLTTWFMRVVAQKRFFKAAQKQRNTRKNSGESTAQKAPSAAQERRAKNKKTIIKTNSYKNNNTQRERAFCRPARFAIVGLGLSTLLAAASLGLSTYWAALLADPEQHRADKDLALQLGPWVFVGGTGLGVGLMALSGAFLLLEQGS